MNLYEINIRVYRHRFGENTTLLDIPSSYWASLAAKGVDIVWLMGVWQTPTLEVIYKYALDEGLQHEYSRVLPNWEKADVIGSPYAIDQYQLHADLGKADDLAVLRDRLHEHGLRLMLDFVPNHFHAESRLIADHPDVFLSVDADRAAADTETFYAAPQHPVGYLAHGKDPNFAAWKDTVQVDYSHLAAHDFMREQLLAIAKVCDGVRCDMAMLPLPAIFQRTWGGIRPPFEENFWPKTIQAIKEKHPGFIFLGEVYWDMEWELQQQGFDYTYDKRLLDRLLKGESHSIREHLRAETKFQERSARFLENHDEACILQEMDARQAQAAAILTYLQPGLRFFNNGQWEGRRLRPPVQLGCMPDESACSCAAGSFLSIQLEVPPPFQVLCHCTWLFYERLLELLQLPIFQAGHREEITVGNEAILAYRWESESSQIYVLVNYANHSSPITDGAFAQGKTDWFSGQVLDGGLVELYPYQYLVLV